MSRATTDLNDSESWPFQDGADEIVIRVSRYDGPNLDRPVAFQAVVKNRHRGKTWGVGVMASPVAALQRAIDGFYDRPDAPWPSGGEHGHHREPLIEESEIDPDIEDLLG